MQPGKKIIPLPTPETGGKEPEPGTGEPVPNALPGTRFLFKYILILMSVALLFVFLSFLSQQRQSERDWAEAQERQIQFSVSALQSIEKLQEENKELLLKTAADSDSLIRLSGNMVAMNAALAGQNAVRAAWEKESARDKATADSVARNAEKRLEALDALWRVERLVSARQYTKAREALRDMDEKGLTAYLSDAPDADFPDGLSAAEEYDRLVERLGPGVSTSS